MRAPLLFLLACFHFTVFFALALDPDPSLYDQGPVPFDDIAELWYGIDLPTRTASLAVRVKDPKVVSANASATWIGLGISEPSSGSMLGADIITAEMSGSGNPVCSFTDRYVPFFAFPLTESTSDSPTAFPLEDDCQDDDSWIVVKCDRDVEKGEMLLEVSRSLDAHDTQDRDIVEGLNSIIYAYGNSFQYHGGSRGAIKVVLYEEGKSPSEKPITAYPDLPDDVDGSFEILATNYTVPSKNQTTYACTSKRFDIGGNPKRMIVAAEPILNSSIDMVHHFTLFLCTEEDYAELTKETVSCLGGDLSGPLANPASGCSTFVFAYAKGTTRMVIPQEAGILLDGKKPFIVMETHFDNSGRIEGNTDNSGVRIFYTNTMRDNEAGSLMVGDSIVSRFGDVVKNDFEYENTCPSECTSKFSRSINIYSSLLHMHTTGEEIYTNKYTKDGSFVENMNKVNFWSDRFQMAKLFDPPFILKPGEQLHTTCIYDTSKRPKTKFGIETTDEMCIDFIAYWPLQRDAETGDEVNICAYYRDEKNKTSTVCGDIGTISIGTTSIGTVSKASLLDVPNPKFEDTIGAPTTFGDAVETCPTVDPIAPTTTPTPGTASPTSESDPRPTNDDDDDNSCFPASARVTLRNGSEKRMDEVVLGDEVLVGKNEYSTVFMFTHKDADIRFRFMELTTTAGAKVSLTDGHFIYVNDDLVMARKVRVGDELRVADGRRRRVEKVEWQMERGLYNPQTMHGDIVVNGIVASTYTKAVMPNCAHALLSPVRWMYRTFDVDASRLVL